MYEVDPDYRGPSLPTLPQVVGYPYLPHNPTLAELDACRRRMRSVRFNAAFGSRLEGDSAVGHLGMSSSRGSEGPSSGRWSQPPLLSEQAGAELSEGYEEEDSSGPETPYSPTAGLWRDGMPARSEQPALVPNAPSGESQVEFSEQLPTSGAQPGLPAAGTGSMADPSIIQRAVAHATIELIIYEFNSRVLAFKFPSNPDFILPQDGEVFPHIAPTSRNKALLSHKHELEKLLDRLDSIQSHGDDEVRKVRKGAVERVTQEMDGLNRLQAMAWYNVSIVLLSLYGKHEANVVA
jgi:hypothetical protein